MSILKKGQGGNVILRNLNQNTIEKLQELKKHFAVGTNSKATILAINQHLQVKDELESIKSENLSLRLQLREFVQTVQRQQDTLDQIFKIMQEYKPDECG